MASLLYMRKKVFHPHLVRKKDRMCRNSFFRFYSCDQSFFSFIGGSIFSMDFKLCFKEHLSHGYLLGSVT